MIISFGYPDSTINLVPDKETFQSRESITMTTGSLVPMSQWGHIKDPTGLGRWSGLGISTLKHMRDAIYSHTEAGKLMILNVKSLQIKAGILEPFLEHPGVSIPYITPTWITSARQFLYQRDLCKGSFRAAAASPCGKGIIHRGRSLNSLSKESAVQQEGTTPSQWYGHENKLREFLIL